MLLCLARPHSAISPCRQEELRIRKAVKAQRERNAEAKRSSSRGKGSAATEKAAQVRRRVLYWVLWCRRLAAAPPLRPPLA